MTRCTFCHGVIWPWQRQGWYVVGPHRHIQWHAYEWDRRDPDYDDPLPSPLSMLPGAVITVIVGIVLLGLALALLAGPEVR